MPVKSEGLRNGVLAATSGVTTLRWSMHQYITIEVDRDVLDHLGDPMSRSRQGGRGDQCKTTTQPMLVCAIKPDRRDSDLMSMVFKLQARGPECIEYKWSISRQHRVCCNPLTE